MALDIPDSNEDKEKYSGIPYIVEIGSYGDAARQWRNALTGDIKGFKSRDIEIRDSFGGDQTGMLGYALSDVDNSKVDTIFISNVFGDPSSDFARISVGRNEDFRVLRHYESPDEEENERLKNLFSTRILRCCLGVERKPRIKVECKRELDEDLFQKHMQTLFLGLYKKLKPGGILFVQENYTPQVANYVKSFDFENIEIKSVLLSLNIRDIMRSFPKEKRKGNLRVGEHFTFPDSLFKDLDISSTAKTTLNNALSTFNESFLGFDDAPFLLVLYKPLSEEIDAI